MRSSVLIALPTFNEIESIEEMIRRIVDIGYKVIVVDNNSTDDTIEKATEMGVLVFQRDDFCDGYGCGIQKAMMLAEEMNYEYLGFIDCDMSYPPEDFDKFLGYLPEYDMVIGARPMKLVQFWRHLGNLCHIYLASIVFNKQILDINSGMRFVRVSKFRKHMDATHMGMVAQMTCFAILNQLKYIEVPIGYGERKGKSTVVLWDAVVIAYKIVRERFKKKVY